MAEGCGYRQGLRHAYPIVDDSVVWEVVVRDLPSLKAAAEQLLRDAEAKGTP